MRKLLLIGGGGHCRSVLNCIQSQDLFDEIGIVDSDFRAGACGVRVLGTDDDLLRLKAEGWNEAFITVGSIGITSVRRRLYKMIKEKGFVVPNIVDSTAIVSTDVIIGEGVYIGKGAIVNTGTRIGNCAIVNTGAIIDHDCIVGELSHISTGSTLCGQVIVGRDTHVGAGTVVRQCITIGNSALIGVGSVVVKDIPSNVKAYGNPCMVIE